MALDPRVEGPTATTPPVVGRVAGLPATATAVAPARLPPFGVAGRLGAATDGRRPVAAIRVAVAVGLARLAGLPRPARVALHTPTETPITFPSVLVAGGVLRPVPGSPDTETTAVGLLHTNGLAVGPHVPARAPHVVAVGVVEAVAVEVEVVVTPPVTGQASPLAPLASVVRVKATSTSRPETRPAYGKVAAVLEVDGQEMEILIFLAVRPLGVGRVGPFAVVAVAVGAFARDGHVAHADTLGLP